MSALVLAAALLAQAAPATVPANPPGAKRIDVAAEALLKHDDNAALDQLLASEAVSNGDPAALINLGTAYARTGQMQKAREAFRAAANAPMRYDLQLIDGSWMDSRAAARTGLARLDQPTSFASR